MDKIRVLIADDHPAFREGLCRLLSDEEDLDIIAMTADGIETVTLATRMKPDVAVIDVAMPGISGIEALPGGLSKSVPPLLSSSSVLMMRKRMFLPLCAPVHQAMC